MHTSQSYQDLFALSIIGNNGNYIELGARQSVFGNNTYMLERHYGWKGISIEFNKKFRKDWEFSDRKNPIVWDNALTLNYKKLIETYNIQGDIDYLSCDLEPAYITFCSLAIIIDQKLFPKVITFEHDYYRYKDLNYYQIATDFLKYNGYKIAVDNVLGDPDGQDTNKFYETWYVRNDVNYETIDFREWKQKIMKEEIYVDFCNKKSS